MEVKLFKCQVLRKFDQIKNMYRVPTILYLCKMTKKNKTNSDVIGPLNASQDPFT